MIKAADLPLTSHQATDGDSILCTGLCGRNLGQSSARAPLGTGPYDVTALSLVCLRLASPCLLWGRGVPVD